MNEKLNQAILNLRAEVLIRKLSMHKRQLSKSAAINLVATNRDDEAFNYIISLDQSSLSSWMKNRWSRVFTLLKK